MECREPGAIRDEELIAYLEGEHVRVEVAAHIAGCQACSSRLATYRKLDRRLTQKLYRWDCPSSQLLGEYHLGLLSKQQMPGIQDHVRDCVLCAAELETLNVFLSADSLFQAQTPVEASSPVAVSFPSSVQDARQALGQIREQIQTHVRHVVALFMPPSSSQLVYQRSLVLKDAATSWPRNYQAEDITISLQLESGGRPRGTLQLIGFVMRQGQAISSLQGYSVQLLEGSRHIETQYIDELGNVVFSALVPACYRLELTLPDDMVITVEDIPVEVQS